jgi:hypothetical protein
MDKGSARATAATLTRRGRSVRRARVVGAGVIVVAALGVALATATSRHSPSDRWVAGFESVDAAVVIQDAAQIHHDLALAAPGGAPLRYDCEIGRRDATRILSHLSPSNHELRRAYETTLRQNWRLYASCVTGLASATSDVSAVSTQLESQLTLLQRDESQVNDVARAVGYSPVFSVGR